jgi:hypothetical protein
MNNYEHYDDEEPREATWEEIEEYDRLMEEKRNKEYFTNLDEDGFPITTKTTMKTTTKTTTEKIIEKVINKITIENKEKKERVISDGQKDLDGHDAILNKMEEGKKIIGKLCAEIRELFKTQLLIKDDNIIDIPYATLVTHMFPGDTVWLAVVGQSSGGKSEILRSIAEKPNNMVHPISRLTQNAVISGTKGEIGLVYEANNKIVIIKDLVTAITSKNADAIFSQLREMFDGSISVTSGHEEGSKAKSDIRVTLIAGVTPDAISGDTIFKSSLGERFIYYMFPKFEMDDIDTLAEKMISDSNDSEKRKAMAIISDKILNKVFELRKICHEKGINGVVKDKEYAIWLYTISSFTAYLRRSVSWSWNKSIIDNIGTEEAPHRLAKELMKQTMGLMIVKQKQIVDEDIKEIITKTCVHSIPGRRLTCLKIFLNEKKEMDKRQKQVKGSTIKNYLSIECGFSRSTSRRMIMELVEMNILSIAGEEDNNGDFTTLDFNKDFIKKFGEILENTIKYFEN